MCAESEIHLAESIKVYCPAVEYRLLSPDGQIITRGLGGLQKKKKRSTLHCCGEILSAKPFEAHVAVQNFTIFSVLETARRGQNNFAAAHACSLEGTLAMGTTYACVSFFSRLKIVKSKSRSRLTDINIMNELRCAVTNLPVDINKLSSDIQKQTSH